MRFVSWAELTDEIKNESTRKYYDILMQKKWQLKFKRILDILLAFICLILLSPVILILAVLIKLDSGPVMFRQIRITQYMKEFKIYKFRTMVPNAEALGTQVTSQNDMRITKIGKVLRRYRLDEIPQLFNIIYGDMTFVGTRPEVPKYVRHYTHEMLATLLLPAGITSEASIRYKDEDMLLASADDADSVYINDILPKKMEYNLAAIYDFSLANDFRTIVRTGIAMIIKNK